ncbi:DUF1330 domain-containing protein [Massilia sp. P8910]|uniref:DUF1330 domain-containing protein n=1 Tax=Massilia antarctica TaxID=2765360 RepID=UPI0006BB8207|nr:MULTISPECIES: DUF1330 domain-containing protein [Massilia]MCE3602992.1 DUF1330 domain-containing protein [Massilia antarctica]MCY0915476.1 DUF1330 domain-containing protein [Massilia sp. H27-R4]
MTVYAIAQISITNLDTYNRYQARFMEVFGRFKGSLLAADASPQVVEGPWDREKVILMSFPDEGSFHEWAQSPEYQEIAIDRKSGSDGVVLLAQGLS